MELVAIGVVGALGWTLAEYLLHRFAMHAPGARSRLATEHLEHHRRRAYFASNLEKARMAAVVVLGLVVLLAPAVGLVRALAFAVGFAGTYLAYELLHRRLHVARPLHGWGRVLRLHHFHHHHVNPRANHGVTIRFWDRVFGTFERPATPIRVVAAKAPTWIDRERDAHDYVIVGGR